MKREQIIEIYRKVYINSEADLPKEDGNYICLHKGETKLDIFPYKVNESHWFVKIDWYLQPIEQKNNLKGDYGHESSITSFDTKYLESKTAIKTKEEILRKVCKYTDIDTMEFDDDITVSEALEAMEECRQQPGVTDEEIEEWARSIRVDFATEILIKGATAMRDNLIPKK